MPRTDLKILVYFSRCLYFAQPLLGQAFELLGQAREIQPQQILFEVNFHGFTGHVCHAVGVVIVLKFCQGHLLSITLQGTAPSKRKHILPQRFALNIEASES